jgi:hypothetical protein
VNPFASLTVSDPIPLPFDEGQTITIRALSGKEIEAAQVEHMKSMVGGRSARGWSAAFQRIIAGVATQAEAAQALADPLAGYDRTTLVRAGLLGWSYPQPLRPPLTRGEHVDAINDLKDEPLEFIAREILRLTKPGLFQTADEADEEKKSESARSTSH